MDCTKTGKLIRRLRLSAGLTQRELAARLFISDRAVSKWERGLGLPDVSLLGALSKELGVDLSGLISGELEENDANGGNMKKIKFYVCKKCGNVIAALGEASVSCCGMTLSPVEPVKADEDHRLCVEDVENEYYVTSAHEMTKEHYISFAALVTGDTLIMKKLYPEWDMQTRIPRVAHGKLIFLCTKHGLMYQII